MKILVLCATAKSREKRTYLKFLKAFDIDETKFNEIFFLGPGLDTEREDSLSMTMEEFSELKTDELKENEKFDLIINEFCPVISPVNSGTFFEMLRILQDHSKKKSYFISIISTDESSNLNVFGGKENWTMYFEQVGFTELIRKKGDRNPKSPTMYSLFSKNIFSSPTL